MNKPTIVAVNVKKLLKAKQMSQKEFATVTGYDYKKLNNKLNGYERPQHIFPTILFKFLYFFQR